MSKLTKAIATAWCLSLMPAAFAQMQIPNPLIQPQKPAAVPGSEGRDPALPALPGQGAAAQSPGQPVRLASSSSESAPDAGGNNELQILKDLRAQLSSYYVSTIVGDQAILRRLSGVAGAGAAAASVTAAAGQAVPISGAVTSTRARSESLLVKNGEPVDFVGDWVTLVPKVGAGKVIIYAETAAGKEGFAGKYLGKRPVVFLGEVESTSPETPAPIKLESKDAEYRQAITPTRSGTAPGGSQSGGGQSQSGSANTPPSTSGM